MKKLILSLLLAFTILNVSAQNQDRKIIIDVTSTNFKVYQSVVLTIKIMTESHPDTKFDIIAYGEAVPMMMKNQSAVAREIEQYAKLDNVSFTACRVSMSLFNIKEEQLLENVGIVDNAVDEIAKRQKLGWSYIKSGS